MEAEKTILGRADNKVSSRAGYAGGNDGMKDGKVYVLLKSFLLLFVEDFLSWVFTGGLIYDCSFLSQMLS